MYSITSGYYFVTSMGFKPMTFGTGIQCSIQLSYEAYKGFPHTRNIVLPAIFRQR